MIVYVEKKIIVILSKKFGFYEYLGIFKEYLSSIIRIV